MDNSARTLKRNVLLNTVGSLVYFFCQWLITGFFVKRLAPTAELGLYNAGLLQTAMTVTNVFLTLASFGMRTFQVSDLAGKYSDRTYIASRLVTVGASILLCGVYAAAIGYAGPQLACIALYLLYKLLEALTDVFHGLQQKRGSMDRIAVSSMVRGVLSVAAFCAVFELTASLPAALAAMTALCYAFSVFYDVLGSRALFAPSAPAAAAPLGRLLLECLPLAVYSFFNTAASNIPRLFLERLQGTTAAGIYGLANSPVMVIQVGIAFLFTPFITLFAEKLQKHDEKGFLAAAVKITLGTLGLGAVGVAGVLVLGRWGLQLLYGEEVAAHSALLVPMAVSAALTALVLFYCMLLTVLRDMKGLILGNLLGIAVSAAASYPLVRSLALFGTSYATILALTSQCAALALFGLHALKKAAGAPRAPET